MEPDEYQYDIDDLYDELYDESDGPLLDIQYIDPDDLVFSIDEDYR